MGEGEGAAKTLGSVCISLAWGGGFTRGISDAGVLRIFNSAVFASMHHRD
jgi:hypothetical protein